MAKISLDCYWSWQKNNFSHTLILSQQIGQMLCRFLLIYRWWPPMKKISKQKSSSVMNAAENKNKILSNCPCFSMLPENRIQKYRIQKKDFYFRNVQVLEMLGYCQQQQTWNGHDGHSVKPHICPTLQYWDCLGCLTSHVRITLKTSLGGKLYCVAFTHSGEC